MHNEIEVPFILNAIKEVGDSFLTDFKKAPIPEDRETFAVLFNDLEQRCLSSLKTSLHTRFPYTPWIEGEFDFEAQKCSQRTTEYWLCDSMDGAVQYLQHLPGWTINLVWSGTETRILQPSTILFSKKCTGLNTALVHISMTYG
jgi:myo-inositol-1(or 4)-monophosphatase